MRFVGPGPLSGQVITQHIFVNEAAGEIRFVPLDAEGNEKEDEVVNALLREPLRIEYYMRHSRTKERVHWSAPKARTVAAVGRTIDIAKSS
mmetsp:Transcript_11411/g.34431  ORF Transcript_11411/g.34431 Transcript_11411/m.34431 type:complete len:91 (-) Transcript_11411:33-305(-)